MKTCLYFVRVLVVSGIFVGSAFTAVPAAARANPKERLARTMRRLNHDAQARVRKNKHIVH